jgi:protein-tyrosine-phosphatase
MKKIEIICLGRNGRTGIADPVFKKTAKERRLENEVSITTAGVYVNIRHPFHMLHATMKKSLKNESLDIYGDEREEVEAILNTEQVEEKYENDPEFREQFLYYFDQTYRLYQAADIAFRNNVLARHGLKCETERKQFPSRDGLDYVFTATKGLVEPAKEMIKDTDTIVTSLAEFTDSEDLHGGFGKFDINHYEILYEQMEAMAPIVLEKVVG